MSPPPIEAYGVGWICALPKEMAAATAMLDEKYAPFTKTHDTNNYVLGRIGEHNVCDRLSPCG